MERLYISSVNARIETETRLQLIPWQLCSLQPDDSLVLEELHDTEEEELPALMEESPNDPPAPVNNRLDPLQTPSRKRPRQARTSGPSSDDWAQRQTVLQTIAAAVQEPSEPNDTPLFFFVFSKMVAAHMTLCTATAMPTGNAQRT